MDYLEDLAYCSFTYSLAELVVGSTLVHDLGGLLPVAWWEASALFGRFSWIPNRCIDLGP